MAKATKLTKLDTRGVAIVDRGANGKRIALAKASTDGKTFEQALLDAIIKGDMPLDDKAVEDMGMRAGLDAQAIETFKAVLKLANVYADNAAFNALLKQRFTQGPQAGETAQPGAQAQGAPGQAPGAPGAPQPGAQPPMPGQQPGQKPGALPGDGSEMPMDDEAAAQAELEAAEAEVAGAGGEEGAEPAAEDDEEEEQGDASGGQPPKKKKPPFFKSATATTAEGDDAMTEKEIQEAIAKATTAAVEQVKKEAADQVAVMKKANDDLVALTKAQETALKANEVAVKKMQDDAKLAAWVAKADKELKAIPVETAETLGQQLFDLEVVKPELAQKHFETLKKAAETVRASGLFSPSGFSSQAPIAAPGSAAAEIEKLAADIVSKSTVVGESAEIARARAEVAIAKSHPGLYKRYCDEQEKASKRS
ncbi:MAG: hypothetical protein IT381_14860 [Deltaproteobacteria bacterium]|nr:hypothetical protein [Deltaproteobacteria bacterium]